MLLNANEVVCGQHFGANSCSSELVLRYRLVSPLLIALIVVGGWYEVTWTYNCLLVDFMWVRMYRLWFWLHLTPLYSDTSRNVSSVSLSSYVIVINQLPRFVCNIEARIPRAKPEV